MALRKTADMLAQGERTQRDLAAAQTGARKRFRRTSAATPENKLPYCGECGASAVAHIPSQPGGIPWCPEWALREAWGR